MQEKIQSVSVAANPSVEALERLLPLFQRHFDVERDCELFGHRLPAKAHFYSRGERYVLTKKAKLWGIECNEHILFFTPDKFDKDRLKEVLDLMDQAERELVHPHEEHMYTYLSAVILADAVDAEAAKLLSRCKKRRNYRLSLHGWSWVRLALMDLSTGRLYTNRDGREFQKTLRVLAS